VVESSWRPRSYRDSTRSSTQQGKQNNSLTKDSVQFRCPFRPSWLNYTWYANRTASSNSCRAYINPIDEVGIGSVPKKCRGAAENISSLIHSGAPDQIIEQILLVQSRKLNTNLVILLYDMVAWASNWTSVWAVPKLRDAEWLRLWDFYLES
jgi:hypothetical protein